MTTKTVNIQNKETALQEILTLILDGREVMLTQNDKPLARVVPVVAAGEKRVAGLHHGAIWVSDDFDEPLSDEFWLGEA